MDFLNDLMTAARELIALGLHIARAQARIQARAWLRNRNQ